MEASSAGVKGGTAHTGELASSDRTWEYRSRGVRWEALLGRAEMGSGRRLGRAQMGSWRGLGRAHLSFHPGLG